MLQKVMTAPSSAATRMESPVAAVNGDTEINDGIIQALGNQYVLYFVTLSFFFYPYFHFVFISFYMTLKLLQIHLLIVIYLFLKLSPPCPPRLTS